MLTAWRRDRTAGTAADPA